MFQESSGVHSPQLAGMNTKALSNQTWQEGDCWLLCYVPLCCIKILMRCLGGNATWIASRDLDWIFWRVLETAQPDETCSKVLCLTWMCLWQRESQAVSEGAEKERRVRGPRDEEKRSERLRTVVQGRQGCPDSWLALTAVGFEGKISHQDHHQIID